MGTVAFETFAALGRSVHELGGEFVVTGEAKVSTLFGQHMGKIGAMWFMAGGALTAFSGGVGIFTFSHVRMTFSAKCFRFAGKQMGLGGNVRFMAFQAFTALDGDVRVLDLGEVIMTLDTQCGWFLGQKEFLRGLVRVVAGQAFTFIGRAMFGFGLIHEIVVATEADVLCLATHFLREVGFVAGITVAVGIGGVHNGRGGRWA